MVSHGGSGRDSCPARGVTDLAIGSSDWLGISIFRRDLETIDTLIAEREANLTIRARKIKYSKTAT